ncbi:hypothetical protein HOP50_07g49470 [Chloropicon primus]|uniref:Uncharacterized protein n=1 Tax=Chloropicon primus TaxID=1764295 RepID=A0A5B8MPQ1_9CHLO|nr:hypothetical protein A3770_07p49250 [Chloropicon primus]UPR01625.1 hypothetical protein HOP50_07g49470 [Chloropicon primus]|mmetsp:Transcript_55/g.135  ORF Transcript_55/g.135 Transcript_55/m.135 type:complete len:100 (+) Transcript_55:262-561(+)|eukprot:QDZ22407.1 hypothetical protein A3770_07p49250 [Chloropicon primus]
MATKEEAGGSKEGTKKSGESLLSPAVLDVIYGRRETVEGNLTKAEAYDRSLRSWWREYSDRKNADEEEHPCDSLYYDRNTLPRTVPPPDVCEDLVKREQ